MARIFISYARKDGSEFAQELTNRLRSLDHEVFLDIQGIPGGSEWEKELIARGKWCDVLIILITESSNLSKYVYQEFREAEKNKKLIIPIQVEDTPLPPHLVHLNVLTLKDNNFDNSILKLEKSINEQTSTKSYRGVLGVGIVLTSTLLIVVISIILLNNTGGQVVDTAIGTNGISTSTAITVAASITVMPATDTHTPESALVEPPITATTITPTKDLPTQIPSDTPSATATIQPSNTPIPTVVTMVPQERILYKEDFEDGVADDWSFFNADWSVIRENNENRVLRLGESRGASDGALFANTNVRWINFVYESDFMIKTVSTGDMGFQIKRTYNTCPSYFLGFNGRMVDFSRRDSSNCQVTVLFGSRSFSLQENTWYTLRVETYDNQFRIYLDNVLMFDVEDDTIEYGSIGLSMYRWGEIWFDNINIWSLD